LIVWYGFVGNNPGNYTDPSGLMYLTVIMLMEEQLYAPAPGPWASGFVKHPSFSAGTRAEMSAMGRTEVAFQNYMQSVQGDFQRYRWAQIQLARHRDGLSIETMPWAPQLLGSQAAGQGAIWNVVTVAGAFKVAPMLQQQGIQCNLNAARVSPFSSPKLLAPTGNFRSHMEAAEAARYQAYWQRYAPDQVTPGTTRLDWLRMSGRTGRPETSRVIYDQFGRQRYRVDLTDHLRPEAHSNPHLHEYLYGPGYNPYRELLHNLDGR
jgi:hypothetical protein